MRTYGEVVTAPYGAVEFCKTSEGEEACKASAMRERVGLDAHDMGALETVNELVNKGFKGMSDLEARGVTEDWRIPTDVADCEDYALLKRKMLMERGWPASALLMTVVRDEKGEGHAVLTARTAQGDFVLDNKHEGVKIWHKTPYQFVMRQSYLNPKVWVALAPEYAKDGRVAGR
ncbi:MAG: transglutaminase-like cysteine peptidase [Pseudomonadaceae bacterium]|nr:transglutaminase-like cysteine peptidase [Pseudomonadaceae bacterium]